MKKGNILSLGQQANWHAAVLKALPRDIDPELARDWEMNGEALTKVLRDALLSPGEAKQSGETTHLRLLQTTTLAATSGRSTIADANAVFTGYLDSDFRNWGTNVASTDTPETAVSVYEMAKDGDYRTLFGSLSTDPRSLCLTQGQIVEFCRIHAHLLRQDGYATFFLFEVNDKVFVAVVDVYVGWLEVRVSRFVDGYVWNTNNQFRLVVPQQKL